jgi:hypothetical protein
MDLSDLKELNKIEHSCPKRLDIFSKIVQTACLGQIIP